MKNFFRNLFGSPEKNILPKRKEIQPVNKGAMIIGTATGTSIHYQMYADALKCLDEMKLEDAIAIYKKILEVEEEGVNIVSAWVGMGTCYKLLADDTNNQDDYTNAADCYQKALAINAKSYTALLGMASVNYRRKDYFTAILYYDKAQFINPDAADAYWGLALAHDLSGNIELAKKNAKFFLEKAPDTRYRDAMEKILAKN
ncbi:MAG TPA: tetratricopeptide repeat protein [Bacteroidia bacterium]|nr:tetratricopeptide repeat protein [Bacteroidia bacterium]